MKKQSFLFLLLAITCAFTACKKDDNKVVETPGQSYFNYKVDGKEYKVSGILAYGTTFTDSYGIYGLSGDGNQETCFISIPNGVGVGTHPFDTYTRGNFTDLAKVDYSSLWGAGSGSVTIDKIDAAHAEGSFQFTAYDSATELKKKTITEGKFNVLFR